MSRHIVRIAVVAVMLFAGAALAPVRAATPDQAKALGNKAAALIASEGAKAFATINDPHGPFVKGELYVVVLDRKGVVRANGMNKLIGMNMWNAKDPDGVLFTQKIVKLGTTAGTGWVDYKFTDPATNKIEPKKTWVHGVGKYVVLCGVYVK